MIKPGRRADETAHIVAVALWNMGLRFAQQMAIWWDFAGAEAASATTMVDMARVEHKTFSARIGTGALLLQTMLTVVTQNS